MDINFYPPSLPPCPCSSISLRFSSGMLAKQIRPYRPAPAACLQTFPPVSLSPLNPCHSSSFTSPLPSYHISIPWFPLPSALPYFFVFKGQNHLYSLQLFSSLPFFPSFSSTTSTPPPLVPTLPPYRWRLTGESSAIRPRDCLLLRRWMEAPSASPTQPQLHQPP